MGLYFVEFGAAPRPSSVLYDRAGSAISQDAARHGRLATRPGGRQVVPHQRHHPGALRQLRRDDARGLQAAKAAGCTVSYDLNYRAKLWSQEKARAIQEPLMANVDVLFTTEEDTGRVFGVRGSDYVDVAVKLTQQFGFRAVVITLREDLSVWKNRWSALVYTGGEAFHGPTYEVEIVDRVGAGDSCSAGYIHKTLQGAGPQDAVSFGVAFSAIKHTIPGDFNLATEEEVTRLLAGGGLRITR